MARILIVSIVEMATKKAEKTAMDETSDFKEIWEYFERNSNDEIDVRSLERTVENFGLEEVFGVKMLEKMMKWTTKDALNERAFQRLVTTTIAVV